jgi:fermentation-respiration switch protein FrsA (DUF1100 family)
MSNDRSVLYSEPFPNSELIKYIRIPILIMHGTNDMVIPYK